jgi:hypothetical protein
VPGLTPGQKLEPPALIGTPSCADEDGQHCRSDRVYLTTDPEEAAIYAALAPWSGRGDVYEVEPSGEVEPKTPDAAPKSYAAPAATIVAVVRRAVSLEEAMMRMTAFLTSGLTDDPTPASVIADADLREPAGGSRSWISRFPPEGDPPPGNARR